MSVISSSFNCHTISASSFPTSFRVVTVAAVASVTSTAGCRSSWSASALTKEALTLSGVSSLQTHSSRAVNSIASAKLSVLLCKTAVLTASAESLAKIAAAGSCRLHHSARETPSGTASVSDQHKSAHFHFVAVCAGITQRRTSPSGAHTEGFKQR
ncbi:hypothetical protein T01_10967 [Trichinella spiralis]|uniref:Uncharacterized protein n=1 Tax=Trichinella spiralis TaxID=6334 RepID=A0A0V1B3C8_TRISP|nr:hypothetical protein T01_10967 [Trichinella spiralis]